MLFIGIDNGVSGSIGSIHVTESSITTSFTPVDTLTFSEQDYVKEKRNLTRVHPHSLLTLIKGLVKQEGSRDSVRVMLERPMVNPTRFRASVSAIRCLECTVIVIQDIMKLPLVYVDSRDWQKVLLPKGASGAELKKYSANIGYRLFPTHRSEIQKVGDADGLLIAEHCRRFHTGTGTEDPSPGKRRRGL